LNVLFGVVNIGRFQILLAFPRLEVDVLSDQQSILLNSWPAAGRLLFNKCGFPLEAVLDVPQGGFIDFIPFLELLDFGPEVCDEGIQAGVIFHHLLMENPTLVGVFGLDEDRHFSQKTPGKRLLEGADLALGEVEEGSVLDEVLLRPLGAPGGRLGGRLAFGDELEGSGLHFGSHLRIYIL
jgi:hypothetical protein